MAGHIRARDPFEDFFAASRQEHLGDFEEAWFQAPGPRERAAVAQCSAWLLGSCREHCRKFLRSRGVPGHDAADLASDVVAAIAAQIERGNAFRASREQFSGFWRSPQGVIDRTIPRVYRRPLSGLPHDAVNGEGDPAVIAESDERSRREEDEWIRLAERCKTALNARERDILRRKLDGQTYATIGSDLGIRPDAARMTYNRALGKLRRL